MLVTIFTSTYNRSYLLQRLYESLCIQSFYDFEWLIIDDGSTDDTEKVVQTFIAESEFSIRYIRQENGGKHRAINHGVREAKGELFLILDSDDSLPINSLVLIDEYYSQVKDDINFGGVCGYMAHHDGVLIGHGCDIDILDATSIEMRYKYHIIGDMCEVFQTKVLKEFPFPEINGEKFCPEALVWNRIATKYKLRVFNKVIYFRDYLDGGLSDKIVKIRMNSPVASMMCYEELVNQDIPFIQKIKGAINYWRFRLCTKDAMRTTLSNKWFWTMPLGYLLHIKDLNKL